ncbi:MAG: O-acetyl-ADP-ribose deacetylase, partial [Erysipelotrichia bacterium]|nr:O-acetyl-ADP-ribose deacetylase [Erysipelotrichia bacterium]
VWHGGSRNEAELLASCYINSLQIALERGLKTIAFSAISTGAYGYPKEQAAVVAVRTVSDFLEKKRAELDVIFCCFSEGDFKIYEFLLNSF